MATGTGGQQVLGGGRAHRGAREAVALALGVAAAFLALALASFTPLDSAWSHVAARPETANLAGAAGALLADLLLSAIGYVAYVLPVLLLAAAVRCFRRRDAQAADGPLHAAPRAAALLVCLVAAATLCAMHAQDAVLPARAGGIVGHALAEVALPWLGVAGASLLGVFAVAAGLSLAARMSWLDVAERVGRHVSRLAGAAVDRVRAVRAAWLVRRRQEARRSERMEVIERHVAEVEERPPPVVAKPKPKPPESRRVARERQQELFEPAAGQRRPMIDLLDAGGGGPRRGYSAESLEGMSRLLELKLKDFGVDAQVVAVQPGPVITRFDLQPAAGVKVSRITALVKDLARSLAVISVRVVEVIPGRSVVGIEIPNEDREVVRLRDILVTDAYEREESPLALALGKDIAGQPMLMDLARMPHLLIAGTTGSGKSVGVNAMLLSILFKSTPEQVRLILVDPKMLELSVYDGIPHLLTPVVTDMKDAAAALRWCVAEMDRRYRLLASLGVRNLAGYNRKVRAAIDKGEPLPDPMVDTSQLADGESPPTLVTLPCIVVVIDEFADMMMLVGRKVEELIARIAQKARAAGIHLVLATQRPSVDVITGLIKANIPGRISFQVSSKIDSRTILDQGGAEQLLGHGDMLFLAPGTSLPVRVHCAFVSDEEVHRVCDDWRARGAPDYLDVLVDADETGTADAAGGDVEQADALYDQAVAHVLETRRASISSVQRKLRIGYNRAARLVEAMQAAGLVSAMDATGGRDVLVPERD
jgi:S-DNA-T family DNA segregation ATPase FtsK/SpoIIIE